MAAGRARTRVPQRGKHALPGSAHPARPARLRLVHGPAPPGRRFVYLVGSPCAPGTAALAWPDTRPSLSSPPRNRGSQVILSPLLFRRHLRLKVSEALPHLHLPIPALRNVAHDGGNSQNFSRQVMERRDAKLRRAPHSVLPMVGTASSTAPYRVTPVRMTFPNPSQCRARKCPGMIRSRLRPAASAAGYPKTAPAAGFHNWMIPRNRPR